MRKEMPKIKGLMTAFPYSVQIDAPVREAEELMNSHNIHHIPVKDGESLVGIISWREIEQLKACNRDEAFLVKDAYRPDPFTVGLNLEANRVLDGMIKKRVDAVLITKNEKLVGIFTLSDVCQKFKEYLEEKFPEPPEEPKVA